MPVQVDHTPNPNAMKFTVGVAVGGPRTLTRDTVAGDPLGSALLAIDGVVGVFMTADFVTLTKSTDASWDVITPAAVPILEAQFG
jgi:hypothetical protein